MVALGAAAPGALGRYRTGVRDLNTLYPDLWGVVTRADHAMRFEQWARMAFDAPPNGDWSTILAASAYGEEGARQQWWDRQVCKPAQTARPHALVNALEGYSPRGATLSITDRAAAAPTGLTAGAPAPPMLDGPPSKRGRHGRRGGGRGGAAAQDQPPATAPAAPAAPKGGVCFAFNVGKCEAKGCKYPHRCTICGEEHAAKDVPACKALVDARGAPLKTGRGKGGK